MSKRRGLGRGLGALIPMGEESEPLEQQGPDSGLRMAPVAAIHPNPHQPRSRIDEQALQELADSIVEHGLIQPLIVHDQGNGQYTLIAGERRWRAAQKAGLESLPVVIKQATPQTMLEIALIENIQRADLNAVEEASAYQQLVDEFGLTQEEVAKRVSKSRPAVANALRLLELPQKVQQAVIDGEISGSHARTLAALPTAEAQLALLQAVLKQGLSVRQTEERVRKLKEGVRPRPRSRPRPPAEWVWLESRFQQSLGTRVNLEKRARGGRLVIHFEDDEDLQALFEAIVGDE
jgi:ParB family transcriptional regulator, chromosome partitioning protein